MNNMNKQKLDEALKRMKQRINEAPKLAEENARERKERIEYYQSFTAERILGLDEEGFCEYIGKLWATVMWGNKSYYVSKLIVDNDNNFDKIKQDLAALLYGKEPLADRWNRFQKGVKRMGPAAMSELLSYSNPAEYIIYNSYTAKAFSYLDIQICSKYDYQCTGDKYLEACRYGKEISQCMADAGFQDVSLLAVDYLMWDELPPKGDTSKESNTIVPQNEETPKHEEIKNKLIEIGNLLGFECQQEVKIATGAKVDVVWFQKIGNMVKALYVFEVQSHGSIDSLFMNLIKAQAYPAVQAVVAVAPTVQLDKITGETPEHAIDKMKFKLWDFDDVIQVHELLNQAFTTIGKVALFPESFL